MTYELRYTGDWRDKMEEIQKSLDDTDTIVCQVCKQEKSKYGAVWVFTVTEDEPKGPYCGDCYLHMEK